MLVLSRKPQEKILISDDIEITIVEVKGEQVKIGITAPASVKVFREEVYQAIQNENKAALVKDKKFILPDLNLTVKK